MQKITPFLWFDGNAEEATHFYTSIFKNAEILSISHYSEGGPMPKGTVMTTKFRLDGQEFVALNGGPQFPFTPAVSFVVDCDSQEEVDYYWEHLSQGGTPNQCGWLQDRYGLSWQIVPRILIQYINDPDPVIAQRVMNAMLQMGKIDIALIKQAYEQR
ncbi:VOC family protein [Aquirhabdus sp.]|uniref:VOC family protein n=1 Tax=Aquirhabdus sp. TaxID=2824160 RepID=UPI00396CBB43